MATQNEWQAKIKEAAAARRVRDEERGKVIRMLYGVAVDVCESLEECGISARHEMSQDPHRLTTDGVTIYADRVEVLCRAVHDGKTAAVEVDAFGPFSRDGRQPPTLLEAEPANLLKHILDLTAEAYEREEESDIDSE